MIILIDYWIATVLNCFVSGLVYFKVPMLPTIASEFAWSVIDTCHVSTTAN